MKQDSSLRELIRQDLSRRHVEHIADMSLKNPRIFDELWELAISDEYPENWRSAWVMDAVWEKAPEVVSLFVPEMWSVLPKLRVDGVKRQFAKIIAESSLPEDDDRLGILLDTCFRWLNTPDEAIAVRVHCMQILFKISRRIPEIIPELKITIGVIMQEGSPAVVSRGKRILHDLLK